VGSTCPAILQLARAAALVRSSCTTHAVGSIMSSHLPAAAITVCVESITCCVLLAVCPPPLQGTYETDYAHARRSHTFIPNCCPGGPAFCESSAQLLVVMLTGGDIASVPAARQCCLSSPTLG
jgi:hypothetical protein